MYIIYALLSAVAASMVAIFAKIGLSKVDATLATAVRAVIMALLIVGAAIITKNWNLNKIDSHAMLYIYS